jgi:hypothetical protein
MTHDTIAAKSPRDAARQRIAETISKHLQLDLHPCGGPDRIRRVAEAVEAESYQRVVRGTKPGS